MTLISDPYDAINTLQTVFGELGTQATGAMNGLTELEGQWNEISFGDRAVMTHSTGRCLKYYKFANAGSDPIGAAQGALNMVAQFAALAGPTGQIAAVALSFVFGYLSLFGAGGQERNLLGKLYVKK